jgi:hypothetical protein
MGKLSIPQVGHLGESQCRQPARHFPTTTLRYYVKVIPENQRKAVADFEHSVIQEEG